jgi:CheY-like chemotaxis protein
MNPFILIVEDDPALRILTQKQLALICHCSTQCVASGEEALAKQDDEIALIFMDIGLPGLDGIRVASLIRETELRERKKRVPIIALTGHVDKDACILAGMDDHLQKPALLGDIRRMIVKYIPHLAKECLQS